MLIICNSQDQRILPALIPGSLVRLNHLFTLHNSKGVQVFLPIDSVLKIDDNSPTANNRPTDSDHQEKDISMVGDGPKGLRYQSHHEGRHKQPSLLPSSNVDPTGYGCIVDQHHQHHPTSNPYNLKVGSLILYGNPPHSGVIKWIGHLPEMNASVAGVEMVSMYPNCLYTYIMIYLRVRVCFTSH